MISCERIPAYEQQFVPHVHDCLAMRRESLVFSELTYSFSTSPMVDQLLVCFGFIGRMMRRIFED